MNISLKAMGFAVMAILGAMVSTNMYEVYNPYAPHNTVAAQPARPYSDQMAPKISRTYYRPLPVCVPTWLLFPDNPRITEGVRGPFQTHVPTP